MTTTLETNRASVQSAVERANALDPKAPGSRDTAKNLIGELRFHQTNLSRAVSWFCPSKHMDGGKVNIEKTSRGVTLANEKLAPVAAAIAKLSKEHNLGTSWKLPALATSTVALGAAHYMDYLSPVLAKAATYIPEVSMPPIFGTVGSAIASVPSFLLGGTKAVASAGLAGSTFVAGTIANATSSIATKAAATASAVDGIWGVSALIPETTTLAIGTAVVGTALLAAYVAKQCLNKAKQA